MIHLNPNDLAIVEEILKKNIPDRKVIVFGSRAGGIPKKHSDLDLCIMGNPSLSLEQEAILKEAFSESDLPMRVDIVNWATLTPDFKKIIEKTGISF